MKQPVPFMLPLYLEKNRDYLEELFLGLLPEYGSYNNLVMSLYIEILRGFFENKKPQLLDNELIQIGQLLERKLGFADSLRVDLTDGDYIEIVKAALI